MRRLSTYVVLATLSCSGKVFAQERCNAVVMPAVTQLRANDSVRLAWLSLLDKEHFESAKQHVNTGATIPVDGRPIQGFPDYGAFSEARDMEFFERKFYSQDRAAEFLQSKLSGAALDAFVKCLENDERSQPPGLHVWPKLVTDSSVDLVILWNVPGQNLTLSGENVQAVNTQIPKGLVPSTLVNSSGSARWEGRFARDKSKEFYLAVSVKRYGYADSVRVGPEIVVAPGVAKKICEPAASNGDLGYPLSRLNADVTGDGCADFCRLIGPPFNMLCTFGRRAGEAGRATSKLTMPSNDGGYPEHHYWVDYDRNGKMDFCRVVGSGTFSMNCQSLTNGGLGPESTIWTGGDKGYGGRWVDNNGDGVLDWCRLVGSQSSPVERCFVNMNGKLVNEEQGR